MLQDQESQQQQGEDGIEKESQLMNTTGNLDVDRLGGQSTQNASTSSSPSNISAAQMLSWRRILLLIMAVTVHNFPEVISQSITIVN